MRVLQLSKFYPPVLGGIESVAYELTEGLNRGGIRTDVLCANLRLRTTRERFPAGYEVTRAASWGRCLSTSIAPALADQLRGKARDHDLVHVHMPDPMAAFALWAARPRAPLVVHWHSDVIRQRRAMAVYEPLQRWLLERADALIATSDAYAAASEPLQAWKGKLAVIPIGIGDNCGLACSERSRAIRQRFRGRRIVFALGRMAYYKGFDVLIDAAAALPDDSVVVIGGAGELLDRHRTLVASRGLSGKVHLVGHIDESELPSHFAACDVFCMPSTLRAEAYGVAMLEAMMMGKPIVATAIPGSGVPWVNVDGDTGFNVPVGAAAALADALCRLLRDEALRRRMGEASRLRYVQNFGVDRMTQRTIDLYRSLSST